MVLGVLLFGELFGVGCNDPEVNGGKDKDLVYSPIDLGELPGNWLPLDGGSQPLATIAVRVIDADTMMPMPATVVFRDPPGAGFAESLFGGRNPDPTAVPSRLGAIVGPGMLGFVEGVMLVDGTGEIPVPAGSYTVLATRGPEYEMVTRTVVVTAGERATIDFLLARTIDTTGWFSADLHVHAYDSFDSDLLRERRVISMVTSGVEILVPTDHNIQTDFSPEIDALGYSSIVGHVTGNEFNFEPGHGGAYPTPFVRGAVDGGAFPWTADCKGAGRGINCYVAEEAFAKMHDLIPGQTAVAINHPWWGTADLGYFTNIGWGAGTDQRTTTLPSAGKFDALEVLNAYWPPLDVIGYLLEDWFALLDEGHRVAALGNSDSHSLVQNRVGYPRNWLRLPIDEPSQVTPAMLGEALRNGRVVASSGPFLDMQIGAAKIGDTIMHAGGNVDVDVVVDAPAWIPVDRVRFYVNGAMVREIAISAGTRPLLTTTVQLALPSGEDSYIVAIASADAFLPADVIGRGDWHPIAIANPIYVEGNNDGTWKPKRLHKRKLSGFDPRAVPREFLLERPPTDHADHDARESVGFEGWLRDESARWGSALVRPAIGVERR